MFCERLIDSGLYNAAAYLVSPRGKYPEDTSVLNDEGTYSEPREKATIAPFLHSLYGYLAKEIVEASTSRLLRPRRGMRHR